MRQVIRRIWRVVRWPVAVLAVVAIAIQFVPYGWWHENPPVVQDAPWPDAASAQIARESCYSCHSNETDWPVYAYVAPMSWLVRSDVEAGRDELNFSDWGEDGDHADDAIEMIQEGEMPPGKYTMIHRGAALTAAERDILVQALMTMSDDGEGGGASDTDEGDEEGDEGDEEGDEVEEGDEDDADEGDEDDEDEGDEVEDDDEDDDDESDDHEDDDED